MFVGAVFVPSISGDRFSIGGSDIIFEDDFDDNIKDLDKWSEYHDLGEWWEQHQRTELQISSAGSPTYEAIETIYIPNVKITEDISLKVSVDMVSYIQGSTSGGQIRFIVTDGTSEIFICYIRGDNALMFLDNNDPDWTILGYRDDGTWSNQIEIYSDRYQVQMDNYNSGWVYDSIFSTDSQIKIRIAVKLEEPPGSYLKVGFDNTLIEGTIGWKTTIMFGRVSNLDTNVGNLMTFDALRVRCIQFSPFRFVTLTSEENIIISKDYRGLLTPNILFGIFQANI